MANPLALIGPLCMLLLVPLVTLVILLKVRKRKKPTTMQDFVKNPFGNLFGVAMGSIAQGSKLDSAFQAVISNPCQSTADALLQELDSVDDIFRFGMSSGNNINTSLWKNTFNSYIIPCREIGEDTKLHIREALIRLSVDHLYEVRKVKDTRAIGDAGEENVWFTLTQLASRRQYNVFSGIRLPYQSINQNSQEIDAIIVCPKGVFLIEVKSVSRDSGSVVKFYDISNPSQQICMHEEAFVQNFGSVPHKNLLVVSYPKDERAKVDLLSFPITPTYSSLTVDDLYEYVTAFNSPETLDDAAIAAISEKLKACINYKDGAATTKWIIDGTCGGAGEQRPSFCPRCGKQLSAPSSFCPHCGNRL